jgi:hypothetical protein
MRSYEKFPENYDQEPELPLPLSTRFFQEQARALWRETDLSAEKIRADLEARYGKYGFKKTSRTIANWCKGTKRHPSPSPPSSTYVQANFESKITPHLMSLDLLNQCLHESRLTNGEAEIAEHLYQFFNDPNSKHIDLIPQLAVIDAYWGFGADESARHDLDMFLALRPWERDGEVHYFNAIQNGLVNLPIIPHLTQVVESFDEPFEPRKDLIGALVQLGISYMHFYSVESGRFRLLSMMEIEQESFSRLGTNEDFFKEAIEMCNWREAVLRRFHETAVFKADLSTVTGGA